MCDCNVINAEEKCNAKKETGKNPLVSTHVPWLGIAWHNETGHLFKIMAIIMLKQFDCRQKDPKTGQQCWRRGLLSPDLSAAQPHQQVTQGNHLWGCCPLKTPNHDTGHSRHQQTFGNPFNSFLLPLINLEAMALQQLEVRFDSPAPVIPIGQLLGANLTRHVAEQVPFSLHRLIRQAQLADNQAQCERLAFNPSPLAV